MFSIPHMSENKLIVKTIFSKKMARGQRYQFILSRFAYNLQDYINSFLCFHSVDLCTFAGRAQCPDFRWALELIILDLQKIAGYSWD